MSDSDLNSQSEDISLPSALLRRDSEPETSIDSAHSDSESIPSILFRRDSDADSDTAYLPPDARCFRLADRLNGSIYFTSHQALHDANELYNAFLSDEAPCQPIRHIRKKIFLNYEDYSGAKHQVVLRYLQHD